MIRLYGIKNCDSVRNAVKFLNAHGIDYEFIDFKTDPVGCETVDRWLKHAGIDALLNTRGTTYRALGLKAMHPDDQQKREWLCKENMLIKRPVIEKENHVIIGFNESIYEGDLLS